MPGVIMQGQLDMVCQANTGTEHDFERDAIRTRRAGRAGVDPSAAGSAANHQ